MHDEDDFVGLVAYSLYKRHKIAFIEAHEASSGATPTAGDVAGFCKSAALQVQLDMYTERANSLIERMNEEVLADLADQVEAKYRDQYHLKLKEGKSFWDAVWENVVANFLALLITGGAVFALYASSLGVPEMLGSMFGYEVKKK